MAYHDPRFDELKADIRDLEHELEIAKLEKKVRELRANIERARAYPPYIPWPRGPWYPPGCPTYPEPMITWRRHGTDTVSVTASQDIT